jgi:hypothetical protein
MNISTEPLTVASRYTSTRYEVGLLTVMTVLTVMSWALRPSSRRTHDVTVPRYSPRKEA